MIFYKRATWKALRFLCLYVKWMGELTPTSMPSGKNTPKLFPYALAFFFPHWLCNIKAFMLNHIWQDELSRGLSERRTQTHSHMKWHNPWIVQQLGSHDTLLIELSQALLKRLKVCAWAMVLRLHSPTDALSWNPLVFRKTQFAKLFLWKLYADFHFSILRDCILPKLLQIPLKVQCVILSLI